MRAPKTFSQQIPSVAMPFAIMQRSRRPQSRAIKQTNRVVVSISAQWLILCKDREGSHLFRSKRYSKILRGSITNARPCTCVHRTESDFAKNVRPYGRKIPLNKVKIMSRPMFRAILFVAIGVGALGLFLNAYPGTVAPSADLSAAIAAKNAATGPLRVLAANPRYFTDGSGKAGYLAGSHTWADMQDTGKNDPPPPFDFAGYLDFLYAHHHNFFRLWACALPRGTEGLCNPFPWPRTGPGDASDGKPRFDLAKFDPTYFDRLRSFVRAAGERGIYVSVMLFDGYRIEFERQPDDGYPLDAGNNVNGITAPGVSSQDLSRSDVTFVQDAYVKKVVDT